jgi:hypothetical protein
MSKHIFLVKFVSSGHSTDPPCFVPFDSRLSVGFYGPLVLNQAFFLDAEPAIQSEPM